MEPSIYAVFTLICSRGRSSKPLIGHLAADRINLMQGLCPEGRIGKQGSIKSSGPPLHLARRNIGNL